MTIQKLIILLPVSWSGANAFVTGVGGLRFKPRAGQIEHNVANGLLTLRHFFKRSSAARAQGRGDGPRQHVTSAYYTEYNERKKFTTVGIHLTLKLVNGKIQATLLNQAELSKR